MSITRYRDSRTNYGEVILENSPFQFYPTGSQLASHFKRDGSMDLDFFCSDKNEGIANWLLSQGFVRIDMENYKFPEAELQGLIAIYRYTPFASGAESKHYKWIDVQILTEGAFLFKRNLHEAFGYIPRGKFLSLFAAAKGIAPTDTTQLSIHDKLEMLPVSNITFVALIRRFFTHRFLTEYEPKVWDFTLKFSVKCSTVDAQQIVNLLFFFWKAIRLQFHNEASIQYAARAISGDSKIAPSSESNPHHNCLL